MIEFMEIHSNEIESPDFRRKKVSFTWISQVSGKRMQKKMFLIFKCVWDLWTIHVINSRHRRIVLLPLPGVCLQVYVYCYFDKTIISTCFSLRTGYFIHKTFFVSWFVSLNSMEQSTYTQTEMVLFYKDLNYHEMHHKNLEHNFSSNSLSMSIFPRLIWFLSNHHVSYELIFHISATLT